LTAEAFGLSPGLSLQPARYPAKSLDRGSFRMNETHEKQDHALCATLVETVESHDDP